MILGLVCFYGSVREKSSVFAKKLLDKARVSFESVVKVSSTMPNLKDIKTRIHSVKSTQKITKAMKMISTARLNKARVSLANHLEYSGAMQSFVSSLLPLVDMKEDFASPIIKNFFQGCGKKTLVIVVSTDKCLRGALNTFLFKELANCVDGNSIVLPFGKKAFEYTKSRFEPIIQRPFLTSKPEQHSCMLDEALDIIKKNNIGSVKLIYPEFISVMTQIPKIQPIPPAVETTKTDFLIEGCPIKTLEMATLEMIKSSISTAISQLLCSEHAARMIAMDAATNNAKERIKSLTLVYNKTRQANITKEILEIVAGSQAV